MRLAVARGGTASVEFVLVLPLILLILFGSIDIGRLLFDFHAVSKSVRDATRYLTRVDGSALGVDCTSGSVNETSQPALNAMNLAMTGTADGAGDYILKYWTDNTTLTNAGISIDVSCFDNTGDTYQGLFTGAASIASVTMSAQISFPFLNGWLLDRSDTLNFTVRHKEVHFGD